MITNIHKSHILTRKKTYLSIGVGIPKKSWYKYPFDNMYDDSSIFTPIIGEKEKISDMGNFPDNISKYIWGQEGEPDFIDWILLCKLTNGKYAFYTDWCDYTGFDCREGMKLYISSNINVLIKMAMDEKQRTKYSNFIKHKKKQSIIKFLIKT